MYLLIGFLSVLKKEWNLTYYFKKINMPLIIQLIFN